MKMKQMQTLSKQLFPENHKQEKHHKMIEVQEYVTAYICKVGRSFPKAQGEKPTNTITETQRKNPKEEPKEIGATKWSAARKKNKVYPEKSTRDKSSFSKKGDTPTKIIDTKVNKTKKLALPYGVQPVRKISLPKKVNSRLRQFLKEGRNRQLK